MLRKIFISIIGFIALGIVPILSDAAEIKIKIEGVGFFNHPPLFAARDAIVEVCKEFGEQVELTLYLEDDEDGQQFMKEKNLSGHLPLALYINGSLAHQIEDRIVVFRDFIGRAWTKEDLREVVEANVSGKTTAVAAPINAYSDFYRPLNTPAK